MTDIKVVRGADEFDALCCFRYRIHVEELGRRSVESGDADRRIAGPLDRSAINVVALKAGEIVGCARVNFASDGNLGNYEQFYGMHRAGDDHPARTSTVTCLLLAPHVRGGALCRRMLIECYRIGVRSGIRWNYIDCIAPLVPLFERHGFVQHLPPAAHPAYGFTVHRARLDLDDEQHLAAVGSPFLAMHRELLPERGSDDGMAAGRVPEPDPGGFAGQLSCSH